MTMSRNAADHLTRVAVGGCSLEDARPMRRGTAAGHGLPGRAHG
jgi:hypothetical protein